MKFDEGKYKSREIYGTPMDPALKKEDEEYPQEAPRRGFVQEGRPPPK